MSKRLGALSAAMIELLNKNPGVQHALENQMYGKLTGHEEAPDRGDAVGGTSND